MKKSLIWIIAVSFSLILGQAAFAEGNHCQDGMMKKMMEHFKLDDAQKAKAKPIIEQMKSTMQANRSQMKDLRMQINQQIMSDNMDQATVDSLIDKKTKLMGDMMKTRMSIKHQIYTLLNPQQKVAYQAMVKKWQNKMASKADSCKEENQTQD
jgi:protein CpxP